MQNLVAILGVMKMFEFSVVEKEAVWVSVTRRKKRVIILSELKNGRKLGKW